MSKHSSHSGQYPRKGPGILGRAEGGGDDERPFAEIRRALHDALRLLALHRWMFFAPFCLVTCAAFVGSLYYPRSYSATTTFEVRNDPVMSDLPLSTGVASFKFFRNTMVRDLTSSECMSEVVESLGLLKDAERDAEGNFTRESLRHRESLARSLGGNLSIIANSPSDLIDIVKITYTGPDATIGRGLVDAVKHTYIRRTRRWIRDFLGNQRDYFLRDAEEAEGEVLAAQRDETRLRLENPHINPADPGSISTRIAQLEMERRDLLMRKRESEAELSAQRQFQAELESPAWSGGMVETATPTLEAPESPATLQLRGQIQELRGKVTKLRETRGMTNEHPEIQDLVQESRRLEDELVARRKQDAGGLALIGPPAGASPAASANPAGNTERARVLAQISALNEKIKDVSLALAGNETMLAELNTAKDELYLKQEEFSEVIGRVAKAKQRQARVATTLSTIEPAINAAEQDRLLKFSEGSAARGGVTPISPQPAAIVLFALVAGALAGALFVVLAEVMDHVFRSSGQVARSLGLPMLEAIDEIVTGSDRRRMIVQRAVVTPLLVVAFMGLTGLTGSMAYLSLTRPWAYQRIRNIPQAAIDLFIDQSKSHSAEPSS